MDVLEEAVDDQRRLVDEFLRLMRAKANATQVRKHVAQSGRDGTLPYIRPFASPTALPLLPFVLRHRLWKTILEDLLSTCRGIRTIPSQLFGGDLRAYGEALQLSKRDIDYGISSFHLPQLAITAKPDFFLTTSGARAVELNISSGIGGFYSLFSKFDFYGRNEAVLSAMEAAELKIAGDHPRHVFDIQLSTLPRPLLLITPERPINELGRAYLEREVSLYFGADSSVWEVGKLCDADLTEVSSRFACVYKIASDHTILKAAPDAIRRIEEGSRALIDIRSRTLDHLHDTKMNLALLWQDDLWRNTGIPIAMRSTVAATCSIGRHRELDESLSGMVWKKSDSLAGQHIIFDTDVPPEQLEALESQLRGSDWIAQERLESVLLPNVFLIGGEFVRIDVPAMFRAFFLGGQPVGTDAVCAVYDDARSKLLSPPGYRALGGGLLLPVEHC